MAKRLLSSMKVCIAAASVFALAATAMAVPITVSYTDGGSEGFNDATLGAQRKAAFEYAVDIWAARLRGTVPVVVSAAFNNLGGTPTAATLGMAGGTTLHANFTGAPLTGTWYISALANQLNNSDINGGTAEITAQFNTDVDGPVVFGSTGFYYGTDMAGGIDVDFISVALHELGHGLGFGDQINSGTGAWSGGLPDIYGRQLRHEAPGGGNFIALNDAQRLTAITSGNVFWIGPAVTSAFGGNLEMFAPNPYQTGSSISHWDVLNSPDLLMEPNYTGPHHHLDYTDDAFQDLGWVLNAAPQATNDDADADTAVAKTINVLTNDSDSDDGSLTVTAVTQPTNGSVTNDGGGDVTYTSNAAFSGEDTFTYTVEDPHGAKDVGTVTMTVTEPAASVQPTWTKY